MPDRNRLGIVPGSRGQAGQGPQHRLDVQNVRERPLPSQVEEYPDRPVRRRFVLPAMQWTIVVLTAAWVIWLASAQALGQLTMAGILGTAAFIGMATVWLAGLLVRWIAARFGRSWSWRFPIKSALLFAFLIATLHLLDMPMQPLEGRVSQAQPEITQQRRAQ